MRFRFLHLLALITLIGVGLLYLQARVARSRADSAFDLSNAKLELAKANAPEEKLRSARGQLEMAKNELQFTKDCLEHYERILQRSFSVDAKGEAIRVVAQPTLKESQARFELFVPQGQACVLRMLADQYNSLPADTRNLEDRQDVPREGLRSFVQQIDEGKHIIVFEVTEHTLEIGMDGTLLGRCPTEINMGNRSRRIGGGRGEQFDLLPKETFCLLQGPTDDPSFYLWLTPGSMELAKSLPPVPFEIADQMEAEE